MAPPRFTKGKLIKLTPYQHTTLATLAALEGVEGSEWIRRRIDEAAQALAQRDDDRRAARAGRRAARHAST